MPEDGVSDVDDKRQRILGAAFDELSRWGIDRFSVAAMADRHGIAHDSVWQLWDDEESVALEALLAVPIREISLPDTGALRDDLTAAGYTADAVRGGGEDTGNPRWAVFALDDQRPWVMAGPGAMRSERWVVIDRHDRRDPNLVLRSKVVREGVAVIGTRMGEW